MSEANPIRVYVTHEFADSDDYRRVFEYLESRDRFFYLNTSRPDKKADGAARDVVEEELRKQIKLAEIVICPTSNDTESRLVGFQLDVAQAFSIPIVGINAFGETMPTPRSLQDAASRVVDWNDRELTDSIRELARGEDTATWDVIEFDPDEFDPGLK